MSGNPPAGLNAAFSSSYTIERELGRGGMATVYLARDRKHDREVALKILRPELAAILGRERFLNEIQLTARLDHPHILTLIDSGETSGFLWYVVPFIRGESLRAKLVRERQLGLEDALSITRQVASALDYAHRQGVIHRDIKPENILLHEGEAMLADFGIALAVRQAGGDRMTETGLSLGTPQYMSPEQATGDRQIDARSDIYSLGAVLYEMLAGEPPHSGPTAQAIVAKLLTERPTRLRVVRPEVPESADAAVARALAKTPADRFASAAEFVAALQVSAAERPTRVATQWRALWLGIAVLLLVIGGAFVAGRMFGNSDRRPTIGRSQQLTTEAGLKIQPSLSPDGKFVAYAAGNATRMRIFLRPVGGGRTIPLSDDSTAVQTQPRWSRDGNSLLFLAGDGVSIAPAFGGSARPVVPPSATENVASAIWSPDGKEIGFVRRDSLQVAPIGGGAARLIGTGTSLHSCDWSPAGTWIACVELNASSVRLGTTFGNLAPSGILLFPSGGGPPVELIAPSAINLSPVWSADGERLFFLSNRDGPSDVYVVEISADGRGRGEPARLTTGLGAISISLSGNGAKLAYALYSAHSNIWSLPIPKVAPIGIAGATAVTSGSQLIEAVRVSRDGKWLLYDSNLRGNSDIYRMPIAGGQPEQLTSDSADEFAPDLSPDGRWIAYHSWRTGTRDVEVKPLDGGPIQYVTASPGQESYPLWSPDGHSMTYCDQQPPPSLFVIHRGEDSTWSPRKLIASPACPHDWSPDGRWLVYARTPSVGLPGVPMVVSAEGGPSRALFDTAGALPVDQVVWAQDGRTIYAKAHDAQGRASLWSVSPTGGRPRLLVRFDDPERPSTRSDFATDGTQFFFTIDDRQSDVFVAELIGH